MHSQDFFFQAFIYLTAAVLSVPIAKRLGLGSVLGYLIAGIVIGPFGFKFVGAEEGVMQFAEFGVVMMLFLIGLELQPSLLWRMRSPILGLGGLQVAVTTVAIMGIAMVLGQSLPVSLAIAMTLALSSTAIVLQTLSEKNLMRTESGKACFSVLLFQDIAVIPMLALMPLLATDVSHKTTSLVASTNLLAVAANAGAGDRPGWQQTLFVMGAVGGIIVIGRFLMRPVFRFIANTGMREIFTATALLLVIGIALLMNQVGLSPALGTFVAGVVLADNEYRHELETNVEPFKGLLLGLFFISVGAGINFNILFGQPFLILGLVLGLMLLKGIILFVLGSFFKQPFGESLFFATALAQGGEFGFVLFSFALTTHVIPENTVALLTVVVALTMGLTPLAIMLNERLVQPRFKVQRVEQEPDEIDDGETPVIIAGFGRFGQIVGRLLIANGFPTTILDNDPAHIEMLRKFGHQVFYGDPTRMDLLHSAGAEHAKLLIIAIDDVEKCLHMVDMAKKHFPHLKLLVRAVDRRHAYQLINRQVDVIERETFEGSLHLGIEALKLLGFRAYRAHRDAQTFRQHDIEAMYEMAELHENESDIIARSNQMFEDLQEIFQSDNYDLPHEVDQAWDTADLRKDISLN